MKPGINPLEIENERILKETSLMLVTLTRCQQECTKLVLEKRELQAALKVRHVAKPVVCAIIRDCNGEFVISQRSKDIPLGGKWEFPGGKVESNETLEEAVVREVKEELGVTVVVIRKLTSNVVDLAHGLFCLNYFLCELPLDQRPSPLDGVSAIARVSGHRLPEYDWTPGDVDIAYRLSLESRLDAWEKLMASITDLMRVPDL